MYVVGLLNKSRLKWAVCGMAGSGAGDWPCECVIFLIGLPNSQARLCESRGVHVRSEIPMYCKIEVRGRIELSVHEDISTCSPWS